MKLPNYNQPLIWLKLHWRGLVTFSIIGTLAIFTLSLQLGSLVAGQNKFETAALQTITNPEGFKTNLINAPYTLPAYGLGELIDNPLLGARIVSVIYALLSVLLIFLLLNRWFETKIAAIGSLLFITSAWTLTISHQATPMILLVFVPILLMFCLARYVNNKGQAFWPFLGLIASMALAAYVPIMIWLIICLVILLVFVYKNKLTDINSNGLLVAAGIYFVLLAPLAYTIFNDPAQLRVLAGIPDVLPTPSQYLQNFINMFMAISIYTRPLPELFIAGKPLIDVFSLAMMLLGIYYVYKFMPKRRTISLAVVAVVLFLIIPLQQYYLIAMATLLPFIFIFITSGIYELIRRWNFVFPRNPFARGGAAILLVVVIGMSVSYNLQKFYIAWPNTPETKAVYVVKSKQ